MGETIKSEFAFNGDADLLAHQIYGKIMVMFLGHQLEIKIKHADGSEVIDYLPSGSTLDQVKTFVADQVTKFNVIAVEEFVASDSDAALDYVPPAEDAESETDPVSDPPADSEPAPEVTETPSATE